MATWSLLHLASPKNGSTVVRELTHATSRSLSFSLDNPDTLSFSLPGRSEQTMDINVLADDVLVYRDSQVVQRFRVVSRSLGKSGGDLSASFSCVSYKALVDAWIFHDADKRSWAESESLASREQTLIAWNIFNQGQARSSVHSLGVTRGPAPIVSTSRVLEIPGTFGGPAPEEYYQVGQPRRPAIDTLAKMDNGFEWAIIPNPASPKTALLFACWTQGDGNRGEDSIFILDDGGNVATWEINMVPSEYANVIRATGAQLTQENFPVDGVVRDQSYWWNGTSSTENPAGSPAEGVWERDISDPDWMTLASVQAGSKEEFKNLHLKQEEITVTLARGRWTGPDELWIGDTTRFLVTVPVNDQPGQYVLNRDQTVRVMHIDVTVDDLGAENVSMALDRPPFDSRRDARNLLQRFRATTIR